jgi:glutaminyl-peptide cyclotransferase
MNISSGCKDCSDEKRALAQEWERKPHTSISTYHNHLSSINLFLLLDLLGASNPSIKSYFRTTHWAYRHMAKLEQRLRDLKLMRSRPPNPFLTDYDKSPDSFMGFMIQDDHIPFLARGVEILHIIPSPFPSVWHEMTDDGEHLDMDTTEDWARIVTAFVGEWMDLEGYFPDLPTVQADARSEDFSRKSEL